MDFRSPLCFGVNSSCYAQARSGWLLVLLCALLAVAGCGGGSGSQGGTVVGSILVVADSSSLAAGKSSQLHAIVSTILHQTTDVTDSVTWSSSNAAIATVSSTGMLTALSTGSTEITAKLGSISGTMPILVTAATATSLKVTPQGISIATGTTQQYKATAGLSNQTTLDVTTSATWSVAPANVATMTSGGLLTAVGAGPYTVTAVLNGGSGSAPASLSAVAPGLVTGPALTAIAVTPAGTTLSSGSTQQFVATGTYTDSSRADLTRSVTWKSSNTARLSINASGLGLAMGGMANTPVTVTATLGTVSGNDSVVIAPGKVVTSLLVKPTSSSIADRSAEQHTALALYADGTQQDVTSSVTWSIAASTAKSGHGKPVTQASASDASVVTVDQQGTDIALSPGAATLQATLGSLSSQSAVLVTAATIRSLSISSTDATFPVGSKQQMSLTGTFSDGTQQDLSIAAQWKSSDAAVATIDTNGWATGVSAGSVTFSASFGGLTLVSPKYLVGSVTLVAASISVPYPEAPPGVSEQLSVIGTYSDGSIEDLTTLASWTALNPTIFPVNSTGVAYALAAGNAQIQATVFGKTALASLVSFPATLKSIQVLPVKGKLALGTTLDFTALGVFSDGRRVNITAPALWTSGNPDVLTIDATGRAKSGSIGTTHVTASLLGVTGIRTDVEVTPATIVHLSGTPAKAQIAALTNTQFSATGFFSDGSFQDVTTDVSWSSSDPTIARVDAGGTASGIKPGTVTVAATLMGQSVVMSLTVTDATLASVDIVPGNTELPVGVTRPFSLIGSFSDGTKQDLSNDATWRAPTPSIVTVESKGIVEGVSIGEGAISAEQGFFSASTEVNVTNATLSSIALTPAANTIRKGTQQQLTATGTFSDGFQQSLYLNAVFSSANPAVAVSSATGLISGVGIGSTAITASYQGKSASTTSFNVLSDVLSSIAISPASAKVDSGSQLQLTATGTYQDQSTGNISTAVGWSSANPGLLTVDETGLATAAPGVKTVQTVVVTAQWGATSRAVTVTIEPAGTGPAPPTLLSIDVTPTSGRIATGTAEQLTAIGSYSDGSTRDLTHTVTWSSGRTATAMVTTAGTDAGGKVTGQAEGTTSIEASWGTIHGSSTVIVTTARLVSVAITPSAASFAAGASQQLTLTGGFSDNSIQDLTGQATWISLSPAVATVSTSEVVTGLPSGLTTGIAAGSAQITASFLDKSAETTIKITAAQLLSLGIAPGIASFAKGTRQQFRSFGSYSDGTGHAVTSRAVFASSNTAVLTLSASPGQSGLSTGSGVGTASVTATFDGQTAATGGITVTSASLNSIAVTPMVASFAAGTREQFTAIGSFSDGTTQDLSAQAVWRSSSPSIATISAGGLANGNEKGTVVITASLGGMKGTTGEVTVTAAALTGLTLTPLMASIAQGTTEQFRATGSFSDGSTEDLSSMVTWIAANTGASAGSGITVASIDASGLATGNAPGNAVISATYDGKTVATSSFTVTAATLVSLAFSPASLRLAAGSSGQIAVIGSYSDGSTLNLNAIAFFESSNNSRVTVSSTGLVTGVSPGTGTITVQVAGPSTAARGGAFRSTAAGILTGTIPVTVTNAVLSSIAIAPGAPATLAKGRTVQFHAIGTYSDGSTQTIASETLWSSSDPTVISVDSSTGLARALELGSATVSASYQGKSATTAAIAITAAEIVGVIVSPDGATLVAGATRQYQATVTLSDGSTADMTSVAEWSSSNRSVATITSGPGGGLAAGVAAGMAELTAVVSYEYGLGSSSLSGSVSGSVSAMAGLTVTAAPVTLRSISVTPTSVRIAAGTTGQLRATGSYSDGSSQDLTGSVSWSSGNASTVRVNSSGLVTAEAEGTTTVQAQSGTLISHSTVVVSSATLSSVAISPSGVSLGVGQTQQLTLTGSFSDGSQQNLTMAQGTAWSSQTPGVASISATGVITAIASGTAMLAASYQGKNAATQVEITAATLVSAAIAPETVSLAKGTTQQFVVVGTYSDGTTRDLTSGAAFSSSNDGVLTVNTSAGSGGSSGPSGQPGLATAVAAGNAQITALVGGFSTETQAITVTAATLVSIAITPNSPSFVDGTTEQFTATGTFSDGSTEDLSGQVVWSSSDAQVLTINGTGLASGGMPGSAVVTATFNGITDSTGAVEVNAATLTGITLTPVSSTIAKGTTEQFTATGSYSDGSSQGLSSSATWTSSSPAVASVDAHGLVTGTGVGSAQIVAAYQGKSAHTTTFNVSQATLVAIAFNPASLSLAAGTSGTVAVIGTFSDGSTQNLNSSSAFTSSNPAAATVTASGAMAGTVSGVAAGSSSITAIVGGMSASLTVTITNATLTSIAITTPASVAKGSTEQFSATGTYSDGTTQPLSSAVSWTSSNSSFATIDGNGLLTGVAVGTVTVSASYQGKSATTPSFEVAAAQVASIAVSPAAASIVAGATEQYQAMATYTDNSMMDVTSSASWGSTNTAAATINQNGQATAVAAGSTTISASVTGNWGTVSGMTGLTVTAPPPTLTAITVSPTSSHMAAGTTQQYTATGTYTSSSGHGMKGGAGPDAVRVIGIYSDGSLLDVTGLVTWSSSDNTIASVSSLGLVRGVAPGTATIMAQLGSIVGQGMAVVSAATLSSVAMSPSGASFAAGATQQFALTGTFTNGSTQNLTSAAMWSSLAPAVATVSSTGLATGVAAGTAEISAIYGGLGASTAVQITAATLSSVAIAPSTISFAKGTTQQFHVIGSYSDGTTRDLTATGTFSSTSAAVVTVISSGTGAGLATGTGAGTAEIMVAVNGFTATTQSVTISPATLVTVIITPHAASLAAGTTQQFTATGTFSDGTTQDLSSQVVWTSSNPQVLTINSSGLADGDAVGSVQVLATLNGLSNTTGNILVTPATLTSLAVTPATVQVAKGTAQQLTATGYFTDGSTQNVSSNVAWTSSNLAVASINAGGLTTGVGLGAAQLMATFQGLTASTTSFTVTQATLVSIAFSPPSPVVAAGTGAQVSVLGTFSDGTTQDLTSSATFVSSNVAVATVSSGGVVTGVAPGSSTITVVANGMTSSFVVTVSSATLSSIVIGPASPASIPKGATEQFTATGMYSDGSTQNLSSTVTWVSAHPNVATVDSNGLVTGTGVNTDQLTASYQGKTAISAFFSVTVPVVATITVSPGSASVMAGGTEQFTATANYTDNSTQSVTSSVTWTSSITGVATINGNGLATAAGAGSTMIMASFNGLTDTSTLTVTAAPAVTLSSILIQPSSASVAKGGTQQFTATGVYSDGSMPQLTTLVNWQSSVASVATINNSGLASTAAGGTTQIWASYQGVNAVVTLTVSPAVLVSLSVTPANATAAAGTTEQYKAVGTLTDGSTQDLTDSVAWTSSNTNAATVSATGLASTSATGSSTITATSGAITGSATLTVTAAVASTVQLSPASVALPAGGTQQLLATATFTDGSSQNVTASVTYTSANPAIATVSATGLVTAISAGTTSITAVLGSISNSVPVMISSAVLTSLAITPSNVSLAAGLGQQLTATGTFSDGSTQNLTTSVSWSSANSHVATVSATGAVVTATAGTVMITATSGSSAVAASITVTVTSAIVTSLSVSPASTTLAAGQTQQFTAVGTMSDGTQQTITSSVHWSVTDPGKGTISNSAPSYGLLTTSAAGTFNVTAAINSVSGQAAVTVTTAALSSIAITPNPLSLPSGTTQPLKVTGSYTDGSTSNLTSSATWTSNAASTATVSAGGVLSANSIGSTTVTATVQGLSANDTVTVTSPVLESIAISPTSATLALGLQTQLTAIGTYLGGATANITTQVQWSSSAPANATVSGSGLVSTLHTGTATLTATLNSVTQSIPLTVTGAVLQSIAVSAAQTSFALGFSVQLSAVGTYSDSSTQVLTSMVTWSSGTPGVGVVNSSGLATGVATGSFNARATVSGITGTLAMTVTSAVLQSIVVTPANSVLVNTLGAQLQFTAIGHYSDGTTVNITNSVHWSVGGVVVGSISQTGLYSAVGVGAGTITAVSGTITGSTGLTVVSI